MVYYKLVLNDKRTKTDKIYPIVVRVTSNRISTTVSTSIRIHFDYWDNERSMVKNNHPNGQLLNQQLLEFYNKVQRAIIKLQDENEFSFENLKNVLENKNRKKESKSKVSFSDFTKQVIQDLKDLNKTGNALIYQTAWNRLEKSVNYKPLMFEDLDFTMLETFKKKLVLDGVKANTISNYFRTIRAIYNRGIKAKMVDKALYPFLDISPKPERTIKRAVKLSEIGKINKLELKHGSTSWHSRNYFILSISLIGISFTDLAYLKPSNVVKGRLIYRRRKTHKEYNIKLPPIANSIIDLYKNKSPRYLLPVLPTCTEEDTLTAHKLIKQFIKTTNKYLKHMAKEVEIDELTTYVARHSWATSAKRLGYSNELIAEALGHEYGNKITNIYLDTFDQSVIDDVNTKVLESLT